jgi:hypothetical protein
MWRSPFEIGPQDTSIKSSASNNYSKSSRVENLDGSHEDGSGVEKESVTVF